MQHLVLQSLWSASILRLKALHRSGLVPQTEEASLWLCKEHVRAFRGTLQVSLGALNAYVSIKCFVLRTSACPWCEHCHGGLELKLSCACTKLAFRAKWNEVQQSIQLSSFQYCFPGLQMQLLWEAEPSSAVLSFGQGVHSSETSEKFSLKVSSGHFVHVAPVPFLRCSDIGLASLAAWAPTRHAGAKTIWCELLRGYLQGIADNVATLGQDGTAFTWQQVMRMTSCA